MVLTQGKGQMDDKELLQELEDQAGGPLKCARLLAVYAPQYLLHSKQEMLL